MQTLVNQKGLSTCDKKTLSNEGSFRENSVNHLNLCH